MEPAIRLLPRSYSHGLARGPEYEVLGLHPPSSRRRNSAFTGGPNENSPETSLIQSIPSMALGSATGLLLCVVHFVRSGSLQCLLCFSVQFSLSVAL